MSTILRQLPDEFSVAITHFPPIMQRRLMTMLERILQTRSPAAALLWRYSPPRMVPRKTGQGIDSQLSIAGISIYCWRVR